MSLCYHFDALEICNSITQSPPLRALAGLADSSLTINYGSNRVRFPAPVPAGSRIRARVTVASVDEVPGGEQAVLATTVEREGGDKPVCVAEIVVRRLR